jgi:hypothetical protein
MVFFLEWDGGGKGGLSSSVTVSYGELKTSTLLASQDAGFDGRIKVSRSNDCENKRLREDVKVKDKGGGESWGIW